MKIMLLFTEQENLKVSSENTALPAVKGDRTGVHFTLDGKWLSVYHQTPKDEEKLFVRGRRGNNFNAK